MVIIHESSCRISLIHLFLLRMLVNCLEAFQIYLISNYSFIIAHHYLSIIDFNVKSFLDIPILPKNLIFLQLTYLFYLHSLLCIFEMHLNYSMSESILLLDIAHVKLLSYFFALKSFFIFIDFGSSLQSSRELLISFTENILFLSSASPFS